MQAQTIVARPSMNDATWQFPTKPMLRLDKKRSPWFLLLMNALFD
jgi:hypothetical protein